MKYLFITLLLFPAITFSGGAVFTNAKLPKDHQIWPLPIPELTEDIYVITSSFVSNELLTSIEQGNWVNETRLITYKIESSSIELPYQELKFIMKDFWPSKESGIMVKKLPIPFKEGKMEFFLSKDPKVKHTDYMNIITYGNRS